MISHVFVGVDNVYLQKSMRINGKNPLFSTVNFHLFPAVNVILDVLSQAVKPAAMTHPLDSAPSCVYP
jgi:hypothetical protein